MRLDDFNVSSIKTAIYNKMKSAKHYRDTQYKRVKPWMEQKGTVEI